MSKCNNCPQRKPNLKICQAEIHSFEREEIQKDLLSAIKEFYKKDFELLLRDVNEVCITSHIFHYFSMLCAEKYNGYNIDPEYNRNGFGAKYYYGDSYAKPDLIIHKRNCNKHNLSYAEFKKYRRSLDQHDLEKILRFTSNNFGVENGKQVKPYRFKFGVYIFLNQEDVEMIWYENGQCEPIDRTHFLVKTWEKNEHESKD